MMLQILRDGQILNFCRIPDTDIRRNSRADQDFCLSGFLYSYSHRRRSRGRGGSCPPLANKGANGIKCPQPTRFYNLLSSTPQTGDL